ncbi:MAG: hypothetical protein A2X11_03905 [Bacteroidetes bacterium GWE2_42_24]|nr:MAG: hypothetical protein A2X11_03905 [Bacteroidetes bacterium GWE2_42_24]OFY26096.1 MAG: hypothetical protein A2X09_11600 [Bacteroidetes bacterium GWF2_43_11]
MVSCTFHSGDEKKETPGETVQLADSLVESGNFPLTEELFGYFRIIHTTRDEKDEALERTYAALALFYHYKAKSEIPEALQYGNFIYRQAPDGFPDKRRAYFYNDIGFCYAMAGKFDSALLNVKLSIPLLEKLNDSMKLAWSFNALGNIHLLMKNLPEARREYLKALHINRIQNHLSGIALNMLNIASIQEDEKQPDSALLTLGQALPLALSSNAKKAALDIANNMGGLLFRREQYDSAYRYYKLAQSLKLSSGSYNEVNLALNLALCEAFMGQMQKARKAFDSLLVVSKKQGYGKQMTIIYGFMSKLYLRQGRIDLALQFEKESGVIKDSLLAMYWDKEMNESVKKTDISEKEFNRQLQNSLALEKVKQTRNMLIYIIVFTVVLSVFMFVALRKQRFTSRELIKTSDDLKEANQNIVKISEIGQDIISHTGNSDIIRHLYSHLQNLMPCNILAIGMYNQSDESLTFTDAIEKNETIPAFSYHCSDKNSFPVLCFNSQQPIVVNNMQAEVGLWFPPDAVIEPNTGVLAQARVYIPLTVSDNRIGVFTVQSFNTGVYTNHHVSILHSIGIYLAIALQNTLNYESVTRQRDERDKALEQLKVREEQLRETNASKDKFFSIIAHDLKNPFSSILGFSDVLTREWDNFDEKAKHTFIRSISLASQSTYRLLENLLMWSRTQTGGLRFNPEVIDLSNVALESIRVVAGQAEAKRVQVISYIPFNTAVVADENMLQTVFRNLLTNAIKFSFQGGLVSLSAFTDDDWCRIEIVDNGIGITIEDQVNLFRIDRSVKQSGTDNETGSGLGLLLCHELINQHGGRIWVESELGRGSRFSFILPIQKANNVES